MHRSKLRQRTAHRVVLVAVVLVAGGLVVAPTASAADPPQTYHVTTSWCDGPGGLQAAVAAANSHPGIDTISIDISTFAPICAVSREAAAPGGFQNMNNFEMWLTESAVIEGNGATIGRPSRLLDRRRQRRHQPVGREHRCTQLHQRRPEHRAHPDVGCAEGGPVQRGQHWCRRDVEESQRSTTWARCSGWRRARRRRSTTSRPTTIWPFSSVNECPGTRSDRRVGGSRRHHPQQSPLRLQGRQRSDRHLAGVVVGDHRGRRQLQRSRRQPVDREHPGRTGAQRPSGRPGRVAGSTS